MEDISEQKPSGSQKDTFEPETIDDNPLLESNVATEINNATINTTGGKAQAIDHLGVVSTRAFTFNTITVSNCSLDGEGATYVQVPDASMDITLARATRVLVIFSSYISEYDDSEWGYSIYAALFVNDVYHSTLGSTPADFQNDFVINAMKPITLDAGITSLKIKIQTNIVATANLSEITMGYLVLGK